MKSYICYYGCLGSSRLSRLCLRRWLLADCNICTNTAGFVSLPLWKYIVHKGRLLTVLALLNNPCMWTSWLSQRDVSNNHSRFYPVLGLCCAYSYCKCLLLWLWFCNVQYLDNYCIVCPRTLFRSIRESCTFYCRHVGPSRLSRLCLRRRLVAYCNICTETVGFAFLLRWKYTIRKGRLLIVLAPLNSPCMSISWLSLRNLSNSHSRLVHYLRLSCFYKCSNMIQLRCAAYIWYSSKLSRICVAPLFRSIRESCIYYCRCLGSSRLSRLCLRLGLLTGCSICKYIAVFAFLLLHWHTVRKGCLLIVLSLLNNLCMSIAWLSRRHLSNSRSRHDLHPGLCCAYSSSKELLLLFSANFWYSSKLSSVCP